MTRAFLAIAGSACLAVVGYSLFRLGDSAPGPEPLIFFVGLPFVLGAALWGAVRLPAEVRTGLTAALVSLGGALVLAETYLISRENTREELAVEAAKARGLQPDGRSQIEVILDLERQGVEAYPHFYPWLGMRRDTAGRWEARLRVGDQTVFPLAGISNVTTVVCNEYGPWLIYKSDEYGFNNPPGLWKPGAVDVVLLGDSFTLGNCVPREQHFAGRIAERFPMTVNLGYTAAGPLATYAALVEYGKYLRPKKVLWFFFEGNDMANLDSERETPILMRYLEAGHEQGLIRLQPGLDRLMKQVIASVRPQAETAAMARAKERNYARVPLLGNVRELVGISSFYIESRKRPKPPQLYPDLLLQVFQHAKREVASWGGELYVVYLPAWRRGRDIDGPTPEYRQIETLVKDVVAKADLPLIDVTPAFVAHPDWRQLNSYVQRGGHYSPLGYGVVADTVLRHLEGPKR